MTLTPVELRNGRWYKREDKHRHRSGVNGGKWRQCQWLISQMQGDVVVTGASVLSPQHAMTAVAAAEAGKRSIHIVGGTSPEAALRHPSPALAAMYGAHFQAIRVGYNPALQAAVMRTAEQLAAEVLRYGVTPSSSASAGTLDAFHSLGARQTANLPADLRSLVVPFGSGNSAASILLGLHRYVGKPPREVHLIGIGPDKQGWLAKRLGRLGLRRFSFEIRFHRTGYEYGKRVRYTADGIELHPTYEAKVAQYCDLSNIPGWAERDGSCAFWIVGAALPEVRVAA